jgi:hypothetical protein
VGKIQLQLNRDKEMPIKPATMGNSGNLTSVTSKFISRLYRWKNCHHVQSVANTYSGPEWYGSAKACQAMSSALPMRT